MEQNNNHWEYILDRAYSVFGIAMNGFCCSSEYMRRHLDIKDLPDGLLYTPNRAFWAADLVKTVADYQIKMQKELGNGYLWDMAKKCEIEGQRLVSNNHLFSQDELTKMSDSALVDEFMGLVGKNREFAVFLVIPWVLEKYFEKKLENLKGKIPEKCHEYLKLPGKPNELQKETLAILAAAGMPEKDREKAIDDYIEEFGWTQIRFFKGRFPTKDEVRERLNALGDIDEKMSEIRKNEDLDVHLKKELQSLLTEEDFDTVNLIKEYIYLRAFRTDMLGIAQGLMYPIMVEVAERLNLAIDDLLFFTPEEISEFLKNRKVDLDVLRKRKESWMLIVKNDRIEMFDGKEEVIRGMQANGIQEDVSVDAREITGKIAFAGKARGKVKIVIDPTHLSKVEKGDVLVATMTFPSFIVAMEKAVAFVTDEGGLLCHAAIISREMKKPCIIGTKIATRVLKDGDEVEVDADKGIVRILFKK
ncbi:MAG: PEP-utilizing enzyme [Patescibacteria group bacterium]|jgi:phosphoenolpyruvate synthase/pyruvate phosphate dikinase